MAIDPASVRATNITETDALIQWTTDDPETGQVEYGTTIAYGLSSVYNPALLTEHAFQLSGLLPGTLYHYQPVEIVMIIHNNDFHITTGTPTSSSPGDVAAQGTSLSISRTDHVHGREASQAIDYTRAVSRFRPLDGAFINGVVRIQTVFENAVAPQGGGGADGTGGNANTPGTGSNTYVSAPDGFFYTPRTGASTNDTFSQVSAATNAGRWQFLYQPAFSAHVKSPSLITTMKMCVGFAATTFAPTALIDFATTNGAGAVPPRSFGFVYDSSIGGNWLLIITHNSGGNVVVDAQVDTGLSVIALTNYWLTARLIRATGSVSTAASYTCAWTAYRRTINPTTLASTNVTSTSGTTGTLTLPDQGVAASNEGLSIVYGAKTLTTDNREIHFKSFYAESYTPIYA